MYLNDHYPLRSGLGPVLKHMESQGDLVLGEVRNGIFCESAVFISGILNRVL